MTDPFEALLLRKKQFSIFVRLVSSKYMAPPELSENEFEKFEKTIY